MLLRIDRRDFTRQSAYSLEVGKSLFEHITPDSFICVDTVKKITFNRQSSWTPGLFRISHTEKFSFFVLCSVPIGSLHSAQSTARD